MIKINFKFSDFLEDILSQMRYIAGKRAASQDEFFKYTACKADMAFLRKLYEEAMAWAALKLSTFQLTHTLEADICTINLNISSDSFLKDELTVLMQSLLQRRILLQWFRLTGFNPGYDLSAEIESDIEMILQKLVIRTPLKPRPYPYM